MTKSALFLAAALAGLGAMLAACASDPGPKGPPREPPRSRLFISPAGQPFHAKPGQGLPIEAWWRQVDRNSDGSVSLDEFRQDFADYFKVLDRDGNGSIDGFEVSKYESEVVPEIIPELGRRGELGGPGQAAGRRQGGGRRGGGAPGGRGGGGRGGGGDGFGATGQGAAPFGLTFDPQPVMAADYDLSRRVTLAEYDRRAREIFALLDADHDGKLTHAELPPPQQPERAGGRRRR